MLKDINPGYSLEGLMLKLQYFGHLVRRADSLEKTLMLGKTEGRRSRGQKGWDRWMASPTRWTWVWANSSRQWRTGKPGVPPCFSPWGSQRVREDWTTTNQKRSTCTSWNFKLCRGALRMFRLLGRVQNWTKEESTHICFLFLLKASKIKAQLHKTKFLTNGKNGDRADVKASGKKPAPN